MVVWVQVGGRRSTSFQWIPWNTKVCSCLFGLLHGCLIPAFLTAIFPAFSLPSQLPFFIAFSTPSQRPLFLASHRHRCATARCWRVYSSPTSPPAAILLDPAALLLQPAALHLKSYAEPHVLARLALPCLGARWPGAGGCHPALPLDPSALLSPLLPYPFSLPTYSKSAALPVPTACYNPRACPPRPSLPRCAMARCWQVSSCLTA